ncbi:hypothetical protein [Nocardia transvalensis]|uniref:hypothetical protein n=1 Tax=Nocardia transvalensis TaxID=37333 RepID=UPI00189437CA|nr:hypothetical protein [Nocardia transvalensis]MBF6328603.1 hypothetical protein [Nocardia transvalensis]
MTQPHYSGDYYPYPSAMGPAPGNGTAITAGVLAALGAVAQFVGGVVNIVLGATGFGLDLEVTGVTSRSWWPAYLVATGVLALVLAALLGPGSVALFRRRPIGRLLIVTGCGMAIGVSVAGWVVLSAAGGSDAFLGAVSGPLNMAFPILTMVFTLLPATSRWLNHTPGSGVPYQPAPYYPPQGQSFPPRSAPPTTYDQPWHGPES